MAPCKEGQPLKCPEQQLHFTEREMLSEGIKDLLNGPRQRIVLSFRKHQIQLFQKVHYESHQAINNGYQTVTLLLFFK